MTLMNFITVSLLAAIIAFTIGLGISNHNLGASNRTLALQAHSFAAALSRDEAALKANIAAQVPNRVANVRTWCGAINQDRGYARKRTAARRKIDPTVKPYRLSDLNCVKIERTTAGSAKHKAPPASK